MKVWSCWRVPIAVILYGLFYYDGCTRAAVANTSDGGGSRPADGDGKLWVICVAGYDKYKYTYGFEAGAYRACRQIAGTKFANNTIVISPDTAAYHVRNAVPGAVVHGEKDFDADYVNHYNETDITYKAQDMTADKFYRILSGKKSSVKGMDSEKVVQSGPQDTVVMVFINIGDYGVMTLTNNEYLYAEKFVPLLEDLKENNKFKRMLILIDGQNAGSMFDGYLSTDSNIIALTNGAKQDDLEICHYNAEVNAFTSTCFMYYFLEVFEQMRKPAAKKEHSEATLFDLFQAVRTKAWYLDSVANLYGDLDEGNRKLSEWFGKA